MQREGELILLHAEAVMHVKLCTYWRVYGCEERMKGVASNVEAITWLLELHEAINQAKPLQHLNADRQFVCQTAARC